MKRTRRKFLKAAVGVTGGLAVASAAGALGGPEVYRWLLSPELGDAPVGQLPEPVLDALLAATVTLTGRPVDLTHYADFFRWRAEHLPGHQALYERFAAMVDGAARAASGRPFAASDEETRRAALESAFKVRGPQNRLSRAWLGATQREWLLIEEHVVREIQLLFAATDAWTRAGYEGWPGQPRGLTAYLEPPPGLRP